jgi:hypothetical protein
MHRRHLRRILTACFTLAGACCAAQAGCVNGRPACESQCHLSTHPTGLGVTAIDPTGRGVAHAVVEVSSLGWPYYEFRSSPGDTPHGPDASAVTEPRGTVCLSPLPPGTYDVVVRAKGFYVEVVHDQVVEQGRLGNLRVGLRVRPSVHEQVPLVRLFMGESFAQLEDRVRSRLAAHDISVWDSPLNHGAYWLLVRDDHLARAREVLREDLELGKLLEDSIDYLEVLDRLQRPSAPDPSATSK